MLWKIWKTKNYQVISLLWFFSCTVKSMFKVFIRGLQLIFLISLIACHKKTVPEKNPEETATVVKPIVKKKPAPTAKVITVSDKVAQKTLDGRYYYDLLGKRYWKNFKDGKYYLFNKKMYSNPDFKVPKQ